MNLLTREQENHTLESNSYDVVFSTQDPSVAQQKPKERRERKKWSHTEDLVLISAWLNTSKNAVVGNAFWSRVAACYAASPKVAGLEKRKASHCKPRWQKINDQVCKFVDSYEAATRVKSSAQNEDDVTKLAYEIFFNDYNVKFTLEHAWRVLRHEQKWCGSSSTKDNGASKRRKCDDQSAQSSRYVPVEEDQARPPGVKASKGPFASLSFFFMAATLSFIELLLVDLESLIYWQHLGGYSGTLKGCSIVFIVSFILQIPDVVVAIQPKAKMTARKKVEDTDCGGKTQLLCFCATPHKL